MPQLQLPIFPAGVTEINSRIAVQKEASTVWYIHGHLPVFQHAEEDVQSFRMFTSQMTVAAAAQNSVVYSNFGPAMSFDTNPADGLTINGVIAANVGQQAVSEQFTPTGDYIFMDAQIAGRL